MVTARRQHLIVAAVVAMSTITAVVYADDLIANPPIQSLVKLGLPASTSTAMIALDNPTASSVPVKDIMRNGMCASDVVQTSPMTGFTITPSPGSAIETYMCGTATTYGIHTCQFVVEGENASFGGTTLAEYIVTCEVEAVDQTRSFLSANTSTVSFLGSGTIMGTDAITVNGSDIGALDLQITGPDAGVFAISTPCASGGGGCQTGGGSAGSTYSISVSCTPPSTAVYMASLYAVADTGAALASPIALQCQGTSNGGVSVLTQSGAPVEVSVERASGDTATRTITLTSSGTGSLDISQMDLNGGGSAQWSFTDASCEAPLWCSLSSTTSTDVMVTYTPSGFGSSGQDAQLEVYTNDPANDPALLDLDGEGDGATMLLDTNLGTMPMIDFGTVLDGGSATQTFALNNAGDETATVTFSGSGALAPFKIASPASLAPGGDTTIMITCSPTSPVTTTATLTATGVTASGAALYMSPPINIALSCTGSTGALLATPSALALGQVRKSATSITKTITVTTTSLTMFAVMPPTLETPSPSEITIGMLSSPMIGAGTSATFDVTIDPSADQDLTSTIDIVAMGVGTVKVPITGNVVTATAHATSPINLGTFCVNNVPSPQTAYLTATGTGAVGLPMAPTLETNPSPFSLTLGTPAMFPAVLPAGGSASVTLSTAGQATAGTVTDTLDWFTDLSTPMISTTVQASFIAGGGGIQPGSVDFGAVQVNSAAPEQTITIKNCGMSSLHLGAITLSPPFTYGTLLDSDVAPAASVTLMVGFTPTTAGTFDQTLTISSSPNDLTVALHGSTTAGPAPTPGDDDDGGRADLYACGCHGGRDPSGALVIGVAMIVIVIPRRRMR